MRRDESERRRNGRRRRGGDGGERLKKMNKFRKKNEIKSDY